MADTNRPKRERTWLDVPFKEKDTAQKLGAKFDRRSKKWYVPGAADVAPFARWMNGQVPQAAQTTVAAHGALDAARAAAPGTLFGSEADFEREAVRLSQLMGQSIEQARKFVGESVSAVEEKAALEARDRIRAQGGSAFDAIDGVRAAARHARHQYFAERQHLYPQSAPRPPAPEISGPRGGARRPPVRRARSKLDDAALGRRYREMIQAIATSVTLRGGEVNRTLSLEQRLELTHRDAWLKFGDATDGDRAIGEQIRNRTGFAAEDLPPQAAVALCELREEAELSLMEVDERTSGRDATDPDPDPSDDEHPVDQPAIELPHSHHHRETERDNGIADFVADDAMRRGGLTGSAVSEQDMQRVRKVRDRERMAAETLLREQRKPMPTMDAVSASEPVKAVDVDASDNRISIDPVSRKPIVKKDGYEVPPQVASRYMVKEGRFWRLDRMEPMPGLVPTTKPHFEDVGSRLKSQQNDRATITDMVAVAQAKNWDSIVVRGSEAFRRNAWIAASLAGVDVKGFKPTEGDEALLEAAKRERAALTIKAGTFPGRFVGPKTEPTTSKPAVTEVNQMPEIRGDAAQSAGTAVKVEPNPASMNAASVHRASKTVAQLREILQRSLEREPARIRAEVLRRFDARMHAGTEIEARIARGELSRDAGTAEIDRGAAELHAAWTAPKAAPPSSPSSNPRTEQQQTRGPTPNVM
ncbi:LPD7 domain-containing protein [Paraburkholderia humisilvae]|uniref:Large polyvalent protein-associated domain-containing protein n=1 Tax=Paraburkholderia humisilvae TaxID=627669 RepID=A0A6J5F450_9BURK|nr:LPD7 domain-containing protein [Paraburkholderia humisilvae]CAB3772095.1 hypothetical protein LMG29542_06794 [Paraburkholderia humisilvae]